MYLKTKVTFDINIITSVIIIIMIIIVVIEDRVEIPRFDNSFKASRYKE
jgi:hypothetical protein